MKKRISLLLVSAILALTGCGAQGNTAAENQAVETNENPEVARALEEIMPEETLPEDTLPQEAAESTVSGRTAARSEASEGFDEEAWACYQKAREATDALTAREEQFLVHTVQTSGEAQTEEFVDVRLKRMGLNGEAPQFSAAGTVKTGGQTIPLEMYYQDGMLYSVSGTARVKTASEYTEAVSTVDILGEFSAQLKQEYIISINKTENADGTIFLNLSFRGKINQVDTSGNGELILNAKGYIISQEYDLTAEVEQDGVPASIHQSVECTVLSYGDSVTAIEFPAPEDFIDVSQ